MRTLITGGRLVTPLRVIEDGGVLLRDDRIEAVGKADAMDPAGVDRVIDAGGRIVTPGFIDIHTHGGGGHDFMDGTVEALVEGARAHMEHGTTTIVPTTLTSSREDLLDTLENFRHARDAVGRGPDLLGLHLEGPYFSTEQAGAQDPRYIQDPEPEEYLDILGRSEDIVRWTVAPELDGALAMGRALRERGILASIGHSNAVYGEVLAARESGYTHITHLYSGMSMVRRIEAYRYAGVVEAAYLIDDMTVEIIADGVHLPESLLRLIYRIKGPERICLVTDSMRAAGMPPGSYILGSTRDGYEVVVEDGVAKLRDRSAFAGSVATADRLIRTMVSTAGVELCEAVRMMTLTPAQVMGIDDRRGLLAPGKDADLVLLDGDLRVDLVMTGGRIAVDRL